MKPTAAQRRHFERIAAEGCALCRHLGLGETPAIVHHVREGRLGVRNHDAVLPLCPEHHVGPEGVHTLGRRFADVHGISERELLAQEQRT